MWEYEYSVETSASPEALWRCWSDISAWPEWNEGVEKISVDGPFAAGTTFTTTLPDQEVIELTLVEVVPGALFVDEMNAGDFVVRTAHRLESDGDGRTKVVYRTEITGPAAGQAGPRVGPLITADFPDVVAALVRRAGG